MARASSGSRSSIRSIEPLISANSAVTVLRSPSGGCAPDSRGAKRTGCAGCSARAGRAAPHSSQNFAPGLLIAAQAGHFDESGAAHSLQNLAPSRFSAPHLEQRISALAFMTQLVEQGLGVLQVGALEAFGEPVVDLSEHRARFVALGLVAEQTRQAGGRAQLPRPRLLHARDLDSFAERSFSLRGVGGIAHQRK